MPTKDLLFINYVRDNNTTFTLTCFLKLDNFEVIKYMIEYVWISSYNKRPHGFPPSLLS